jgi:hypothetical protein
MRRVVAALFLSLFTGGSLLHSSRQAPTDLQVGSSQFISYQDLLHLPQTSFTTLNDSNFPVPARVGGVPLEQLKKGLHGEGDMVVAICGDGYRSNYPASYLEAHHPVLVLTVNGKAQDGWPKTPEGGSLGPYVVANPSFVPGLKILSQSDEPRIPFEVVRVDFRKESEVFGPIARDGVADSPVMAGYAIAKQNCYRCHNMGAEGGTMASVPWPVLGALAKSSPDFFARYVRNPQAMNPRSRMAASPEYDDQTIAALEAYFSTFAAGDQK